MGSYKAFSYDIKKNIVDIIVVGGGGHISGGISVTDILPASYPHVMNISPENKGDENRDTFVISKGHRVEVLYAVLAAKEFFSLKEVKEQFLRFGFELIGHPNNKLPGIEASNDSLGRGLPVSIGMALAFRMDSRQSRIYVAMRNGELAEGPVWEGAMAVSMYHPNNFCAVVDRNHLQTSDGTEEVIAHDSQTERWPSFGWNVIDVTDGDDSEQLLVISEEVKTIKREPMVVIANTVEDCGPTTVGHKAAWHRRVSTAEEYAWIIKDSETRKKVALNG